MDGDIDWRMASVAAAIAEPARARMLCLLLDGCARTATELASAADVAASTASAHLAKLKAERLVQSVAQGKHRYFTLSGREVAAALEALQRVAGGRGAPIQPRVPGGLRHARSCYDHAAGQSAVALHDRMLELKWLLPDVNGYDLSAEGERALRRLGLDCEATRSARRRFAYPCLDWSERRAHVGGALGAALLAFMLARKWMVRGKLNRALRITEHGQQAFKRLGVAL